MKNYLVWTKKLKMGPPFGKYSKIIPCFFCDDFADNFFPKNCWPTGFKDDDTVDDENGNLHEKIDGRASRL